MNAKKTSSFLFSCLPQMFIFHKFIPAQTKMAETWRKNKDSFIFKRTRALTLYFDRRTSIFPNACFDRLGFLPYYTQYNQSEGDIPWTL